MEKDKRIFIGGAWPYANNSLHVGHLAALLPGDVIARYFRLNGNTVIYVSGTDSHGTPITERAKKENVSPYDIAQKYHEEFLDVFSKICFSYDLYTATFTNYHKEHVMTLIKKAYDNGFIYEKQEEQDYCENCESFLTDREIVGNCPVCGEPAKGDQCDACLASFDTGKLLNKHCKACGIPTITRQTKHLMFKLSEFQNFIDEYMINNKEFWRWNAINETKKYLELGLPDRAVTRTLNWGVDVPIPAFEDKKIYVWFEAVLGYLTAGRFVAERMRIDFDEYMKDDGMLESYYIHGKDNIPFHTVIFPALIGALQQNIQLPKHIISSEYVNLNDEKMSKSKGNFKSISELGNSYTADTIRFYILHISPERKDANFSTTDMILFHNKFLVGGFGNFVNRNLSFLKKKFGGAIPNGKVDEGVIELTKSAYEEFGDKVRKGEMRDLSKAMISYIHYANKYYDDNAPWILVKNNIEAFNNVTASCLYIMANMVNLFSPVLPQATEKLKNMLQLEKTIWEPITLKKDLVLSEIDVLYSKIEIEE